MSDVKVIIGKKEWCSLPELGLPAIKLRVDSGAKTSSLHAFNITTFEEDGKGFVDFDIHPLHGNRTFVQHCRGVIVDQRKVKNSSGDKERRLVIKTPITLGGETWDIEVSLTNRDSMGYRMLLGREAMVNRVLIDPDSSMCLGNISKAELNKLYPSTEPKSDSLNIIVLATNSELYSNKRLMEAGEERGHNMSFVDISQCYMNISADKPAIYYRGGQLLGNVDAVIPRIRPAMTFYGCSVMRQFHVTGAYCLNSAVSIARSRDKLRSLQLLSNKGVAMPVTGFANSPIETADIIKMVGGAPVVIKLLEGTQGKGVVLADTNKAAESVINAFKSLQANILVQEYIKEANGKDIRCFVIDGKVVGSIQREAAEGEFRANLHLGGFATPIKITAEERKMAVAATKIMGLQVAGVDLIRSKSGPKVLEINSSPGLEGIENNTNKDIAGLMIECIEKNIKDKRRKRKSE